MVNIGLTSKQVVTMDFIHAADIHLGYRQYGLDERFRDFGASFLDIAKYAIEHKAGFVLIAGDLFDKKTINAATFTQARHVLSMLKDEGIKCIAIEGNHDRYFSQGEMSWLEALEHQDLIKLIKPGEQSLMSNYVDIDGVRIFGICYAGSMTAEAVPVIVEDIKRINAQSPPKYTVLMMHLGVQGKMNGAPGEVQYEDLVPLRDIVDYLALGHYHNAFEVDGWVYNPGSPETCSISEAYGPKGFYHVNGGCISLVSAAKRKFILIEIKLDNIMDNVALASAVEKKLRKEKTDDEMPVVIITLKGNLNFDRSHIRMDLLKEKALEILHPLYVDVRLDLSNDTFAISGINAEELDRKAIEREVFRRIVAADSMMNERGEEFAANITDIKEMVLRGADDDSLNMTLRAVFNKVTKPDKPDDGEWDWRPGR